MSEAKDWLDDLLEQVASGRMQPEEALNRFFLHKKEAADATLTETDHAFLNAMDAVEAAHLAAKWCARHAAAQGGVADISVDLRGPGFFSPGRRPPSIVARTLDGQKVPLFGGTGVSQDGEYAQDCIRVSGSFAGMGKDPVFKPVFMSALDTALKGHGLPGAEYRE